MDFDFEISDHFSSIRGLRIFLLLIVLSRGILCSGFCIFFYMFCRVRNKRLQIFFKIPERKLFLAMSRGLIFRFRNKAAGLDIDIIQCLVLFCFIRHAFFLQTAVDVALDQRIKNSKDRNTENHAWYTHETTEDGDGKNNSEPGKTGGIAKNLRPKEVAVKLLQNPDEDDKIQALHRIDH